MSSVVKFRPSRDFAVRQAVLTALHENYPFMIQYLGLAETCRSALLAPLSDGFVWDVRRHYRALQARYELQAMTCR